MTRMSWEDYEELTGERHENDPRGGNTPPSGDVKRARGEQNRRSGESFEALINRENRLLEDRGLVDVTKIPTPRRRISRPSVEKRLGDAQAVCVRKPAVSVDYQGTVSGGRAVYFEAKTDGQGRRSWSFSALSETQRERLESAAALGALAFVYVQDRSESPFDRYVFPVDPGGVDGRPGVIAGVDESSTYTQSIRWENAGRYQLEAGSTWLEQLEKLGRITLDTTI